MLRQRSVTKRPSDPSIGPSGWVWRWWSVRWILFIAILNGWVPVDLVRLKFFPWWTWSVALLSWESSFRHRDIWVKLLKRKEKVLVSNPDGYCYIEICNVFSHSNNCFFSECLLVAENKTKYKLWGSFYLVTVVYIYLTRIMVELLKVALPFQYVQWLVELLNEAITLGFYATIG